MQINTDAMPISLHNPSQKIGSPNHNCLVRESFSCISLTGGNYNEANNDNSDNYVLNGRVYVIQSMTNWCVYVQ